MKLTSRCFNGIVSLVLFLFSHFSAVYAVEKVYGYCPDSISENVYPVGVKGQQAYLSTAVKFTANTMQSLKGNQITKIRIGIGEGMQNVYVWVRVGTLDVTPVVLQKVNSPVKGWNEVTLSTPYDIDGSEIYVGYSGRQPSSSLCVWLDGEDNANATFIMDGSSWDDYYGYGWGSLCIQAIVSGDNFAESDLAVESIVLDSAYYRNTSSADVVFTVVNQGTKDYSRCYYTVKVDDGKNVSESGYVAGPIAPSAKLKIEKTLDLTGLSEGVHTLTFYLDQEESGPAPYEDMVLANDTLSKDLLVYTNEYKKNVLIEQFTTIACVNCPYGDAVLNKAVLGRDNVAWVAHHVGYYTDELTVSESSSYMDFGINAAPMGMVDRTFLQVQSDQTTPAFSLGYSDSNSGAKVVQAMMDYQCSFPAFVQVTPSCNYDEVTRQLAVSVNGECNGIFQNIVPDSRLTIFLTEDNVTAKRVQTGTTDDYTHHHVLRSVLTDTFGDVVEWKENAFNVTKTVILDESWKPADIKAVAFISKPFNTNNVNNAQVINAATATISNLSAIADVENGGARLEIRNGQLLVGGQCDDVEVFAADGSKVSTNGLHHGIYIIKVHTNGKVTTKKLIY